MTALYIIAMLPLVGICLSYFDQEWFEFIVGVTIFVGVVWLFVWGAIGLFS